MAAPDAADCVTMANIGQIIWSNYFSAQHSSSSDSNEWTSRSQETQWIKVSCNRPC